MIKQLLLLALLSLPLAGPAHAATVNFMTEEYPPFSYHEGDKLKGASVEQVHLLMQKAGIDMHIELMPWTRAYAAAQATPMTCLFTTAHSPERDKLFKWVEPLLVDNNVLVSTASSGIGETNLEDTRRYVVGTHRGDYTEKLLKEKGFPRVDVASDFPATLRKLLNGRIDLMPISEIYFEKLKLDQPLVRVAKLSSQSLGIACEKSFPEDLRARMQQALDALIADGTQRAIFAKYGLHSRQ
jgi:polar amino acid transport system substrate-binding protein